MHIQRHDFIRHIDHQLRDIGATLETPSLWLAVVIFALLAIGIVMHHSGNGGMHAARTDAFPAYAHIEGFDP